jgi:hypothetical protein
MTPDGPQFEQLKMFMTPAEIDPSSGVDSPYSTVVEHHQSAPERVRSQFGTLMEEKTSEAKYKGLTKDIKKRGVVMPVQVIHTAELGRTLGHGHHRFAAAKDIDPDMLIPVHHTEGRVISTRQNQRDVHDIDWWKADDEYQKTHGWKGTSTEREDWA